MYAQVLQLVAAMLSVKLLIIRHGALVHSSTLVIQELNVKKLNV